MLIMRRDDATAIDKYVAFKRAIDTYRVYLAQGNRIGAYVVVFSILEDRLSACYFLLHQEKNLQPRCRHPEFMRRLGFVKAQSDMTNEEYSRCAVLADERNRLIHAAMWNLDAFDQADFEGVINAARKLDNRAKRLRRARKKRLKAQGGCCAPG